MSQVVKLDDMDVSAKNDTRFNPNSCCHKEKPPTTLYTDSPATGTGNNAVVRVTKVTPYGFVAVTALVNIKSLVATLYLVSCKTLENETKLPGLNVIDKSPTI
jgi:hypothetical protein